jgi:hypothetical protein
MTKISDELRKWCDESEADWEGCDLGACDELRVLADRIDAEMVELPKDADGAPIHVGDTVWDVEDGMEFTVRSTTLYAGGAAKVNAFTEGCDAHVSPACIAHTPSRPRTPWSSDAERMVTR